MEMLQKLIREAVQKMDLKLPDAEREKYVKLMVEIFDKEKSPYEAIGFSEDMMEYMYNYGYRLYNNGSYKSARDVFEGLTLFMPKEGRFYLALAASYHRLKDYAKAIDYYLMYGGLEQDNPVPYYYMYDCYYQVGYVGDAEVCLLEVIRRCGDNPIYAKIKERSQLMLDNLKSEVEQLKKNGELVLDSEEKIEPMGINLDEETVNKLEAQIKIQKNASQSIKEETKEKQYQAEVKKS